MNYTTNFSIKRIFLLIQKYIVETKKHYLKTLIILLGIPIFALIISYFNNQNLFANLSAIYKLGLLIFGILIINKTFYDLRNKEKTPQYLTIPASNAEKLISELTISTIVFFIFYNSIFYIFNFITLAAGKFLGIEVEIISIFDVNILKMWGIYIIIMSIFLVGAATFHKNHIRATLLTITALITAVFLYTILLITILVLTKNLYFENFPHHMNHKNVNLSGEEELLKFKSLFYFIKYFVFYALSPILWIVTYFKLKERQN